MNKELLEAIAKTTSTEVIWVDSLEELVTKTREHSGGPVAIYRPTNLLAIRDAEIIQKAGRRFRLLFFSEGSSKAQVEKIQNGIIVGWEDIGTKLPS